LLTQILRIHLVGAARARYLSGGVASLPLIEPPLYGVYITVTVGVYSHLAAVTVKSADAKAYVKPRI